MIWAVDSKKQYQEAKAEYEKQPVLCPVCSKPLTYRQALKGQKCCSAVCGRGFTAAAKVGRPHPHPSTLK